MRCRRVLLAGLLASSAAVGAARADPPGPAAPTQPQPPTPAPKDLRDTFGLTRPPATRVDCGDRLAVDCAIATDPLDGATPYALSTW